MTAAHEVPRRRSTFGRFCLVGAIGFIIDAAALVLAHEVVGLDPIASRCLSILIALTVTWWLHRHFTFQSQDPSRLAEWGRFAAVNGVGALINFVIYSLILLLAPQCPPLLALAVGSAVALLANYAGAKGLAFRIARTHAP